MNEDESRAAFVVANPWQALRALTPARIALGRTGVSQPTDVQLAFRLAHASARDAVHLALDVPQLLASLDAAGVSTGSEVLVLDSAAGERLRYLQRPDLGRRLDDASRRRLVGVCAPSSCAPRTVPPLPTSAVVGAASDAIEECAADITAAGDPPTYDLALVIADGLSPLAISTQAPALLAALLPRLAADQRHEWHVAPITVVRQGRVAIGDEIGALLRASIVVVLIGERPGLSSPDSMGLYLTFMPRVGLTDASRNCISNVRHAGLAPADAASRLHYLLSQARCRQLSGVGLKDDSKGDAALSRTGASFLLTDAGH